MKCPKMLFTSRFCLVLAFLSVTSSTLASVIPASWNFNGNNCTIFQGNGSAISCCNTECIDGTKVGQPGECLNYENICVDASPTPQCKTNQLLSVYQFPLGVPSYVGGDCSLPGFSCPWARTLWSWTCCDCPQGYIAAWNGDCAQPSPQNWQSGCVGCPNNPGFVPVLQSGNPSQWFCVPGNNTTSSTYSSSTSSSTSSSSSSSTEAACAPIATGSNGKRQVQNCKPDKCDPFATVGDGSFVEPCGPGAYRGNCPVDTFCTLQLAPQDNCPGTAYCSMNNRGYNFLKSFEKGCPYLYKINGDGTIGWGHDCKKNAPHCSTYKDYTLAKKNPFLQSQADALLDTDLANIAKSIGKWTNSNKLNSNQLAALIDYAYQYGPTAAFKSSLHTVVKSGILNNLCATFLTINAGDARMIGRSELCNIPTTQLSGCVPA